MDDFLIDLRKPYWWLGVVVVGLTLNVVASYIRDFIDRTRRGYAELRVSAAKLKEQEIARQAAMIKDPFSLLYHHNRSLSSRIDGVFSLVYSIALFAIATVINNQWVALVFFSASALSALTGFKLNRLGNYMETVANEASQAKQQQPEAKQIEQ